MVKRDLFRQLLLLVLLILGIIGLRVWLFEPVRITSTMANDYIKRNDVIIALKNTELKHGEFVLYEHEGKEHVSRIIALEEETATYLDNVLYRNQKIVREDYLELIPEQEYYTEDLTIETLTGGEFQVIPKGKILVLNDNRMDRNDSRSFGLIDQSDIIGRLSFKISPLSEFGFIETGLTQ